MQKMMLAENGKVAGEAQPASIHDALSLPDTVVWLDIQDPTDDDEALLSREFGFHPLAIEDAIRGRERPKVEAHGSYYFLVFYAARFDPGTAEIMLQGLYVFVSHNYLVTVHAGQNREVEDTMARWRATGSPLANRIGALIYALLDAVVDEYFPLMDEVADRIENLEDTIFIKFNEAAIQTIFSLKPTC